MRRAGGESDRQDRMFLQAVDGSIASRFTDTTIDYCQGRSIPA